MAQNVTTNELAGGTVPAPAAERMGSVDSALDKLWHFLTSMKLALVLMLAFAALTLVGTLVIQAPAGVADDPQAKAELAGRDPTPLRRLDGPHGPPPGLRDLHVGLAAGHRRPPGRFARGLHRAPDPGHLADDEEATRRRGAGLLRARAPARGDDVPAPAGRGPGRGPGRLRRHHYRTITEDDGTVHLYAVRNNWAPWAGLVAHISIVVILAGAMIGSMFGFRDSQFMLAEGATSAIPNTPGATITLNSFKDTYNTTTGAPLDYVSDVTVSQDGQVVARQLVRVNDPLRYKSISFFQAFFGPAAVVTVKDAAGTTLFSEGVALAWTANNGGNKVGSFTIPDKNLTAWIVATTGPNDPDVKPGQIAVELYKADTGEAVVQKSIDQGVATTIEGLSFTFDREAKFTGLSVANDPGTPARLARLHPPGHRLRHPPLRPLPPRLGPPGGAAGRRSHPLHRRGRPPRHRLRHRVHHHRHRDPPGHDGRGAELGSTEPWKRWLSTRSKRGSR